MLRFSTLRFVCDLPLAFLGARRSCAYECGVRGIVMLITPATRKQPLADHSQALTLRRLWRKRLGALEGWNCVQASLFMLVKSLDACCLHGTDLVLKPTEHCHG